MSVVEFDLTEGQVEQVLAEALQHDYWELDVDGQMPREFRDREVAARDLVRQCVLSRAAGNPADGITSILSVAGVDPARALQPAQPASVQVQQTRGEEMATTTETDLSQYPVPVLYKFRETMLNYPDQSNPEVQQNIQQIDAELARRGEAPAVPVGTPPAPPAPPVSPAVASIPSTPPAPPQPQQEASPSNSPVRAALIDQVTIAMLRAHNLDPSQVDALSDDQLRSLVATGAPAQAPPPPPAPVAVPTPPQPQPTGPTVETTHMVVQAPPPLPPDRPGPVEASAPVESEREKLEAQVTGPMLTAYGRKRVEVPSIGDNELRFMIEHPKGDVTQEMLLAERAKDGGEVAAPVPPSPAPSSAPPVPDPAAAQSSAPPVPSGGPTVPQPPDPTTDPAYQQLVEATQVEQQREWETQQVGASTVALPQRVTRAAALGKEPPSNPAQEVIDAEHFPVPPEIDGKPPRLPFDLSVVSDDDLRAYHSQFHACHSRANYVVGLWEGELRDITKLRKGREVEAANAIGSKDPEDSRKRLTDAQREALVAADPEVVALKEREHEIERVLRQLQRLRDGYSSDVSTCSRQWSMRKLEQDGAGGIR